MKNKKIVTLDYEMTRFLDGSVLRNSYFFNTKELAIKYLEQEAVKFKLNLIKNSDQPASSFEIYIASNDFMSIKYFLDYAGIYIMEKEEDFPTGITPVWFTKNPKWVEEEK